MNTRRNGPSGRRPARVCQILCVVHAPTTRPSVFTGLPRISACQTTMCLKGVEMWLLCPVHGELRISGSATMVTPKSKTPVHKQLTQMCEPIPSNHRRLNGMRQKSGFGNDSFELVHMRKHSARNYVTGRLVVLGNRAMHGTHATCEARWVLRAVQDEDTWEPQADRPTATRPAFLFGMSTRSGSKVAMHGHRS